MLKDRCLQLALLEQMVECHRELCMMGYSECVTLQELYLSSRTRAPLRFWRRGGAFLSFSRRRYVLRIKITISRCKLLVFIFLATAASAPTSLL